jgi:heterodisulfide reductase subunit C/quinone-modifying oxidoreductase subunit QmoC
MSLRDGAAGRRRVAEFHQAFLKAVRTHGRVHELEMIARYKLRTGAFLDDADLGAKMFVKGRLRLVPERIRDVKEVRRILDQPPSAR